MKESIMGTSKSFIEDVEQRIDHSLAWDKNASYSDMPTLASAARHLCLAPGGKRARPKLAYYFGLSVDSDFDLLADVGVAAEFIHGASLLHDDVIDHGTLRRGLETVNIKWDNLTAVLAGDLLLAESIKGLSRCPRSVAQEALDVVAQMTRATMLEAHVRGSTETTLEQYRYIALGKTAAMFSWCGRSAAYLGSNVEEISEALERFGKFGQHFGVAFQMADDLLDLQKLESGKTPFADIRNRNPNYPLILAQNLDLGFREKLNKAWQSENTLSESAIASLGAHCISTGAAAQTLESIHHEIQIALDALGDFKSRRGCREIAAWADTVWKRFQHLEAV
jgi:geranylgeranyl pyrophosphate synthase